MTERLDPAGMVPQRSGGQVHERASGFRPRDPILERPRPYEAMECEGYDAMRRMIRHRIAARGIRGFDPAERFIAVPPDWRDQPRPPMSPTAAF